MTPAVAALAATAALLLTAATSWARYTRTRRHSAPADGATERWSPLATIGAQTCQHALDPAPTLAATHAELTAIGDALTVFGRNIDNALWEFMRPLDAETTGRLLRAREWAANPATGELDLVGLQALLTEGRELVPAC
jgi:hypothetical protein